jgi:hypothetical protein
MHRRPNPEEHLAVKVALDALITRLGLRPGDDARPPERGALARLAEAVGVSEQRVRAAYSGAVAVRPDTLTRWALAIERGTPDEGTPDDAESVEGEESAEGTDAPA